MNRLIEQPSGKEVSVAAKSYRTLLAYIQSTNTPTLHLVKKGHDNEKIELPTLALQLLVTILEQMAEGNTVSVIPIHTELTTQQAADLLNVSRPYLINLLNQAAIPFRSVGTKRRILAADILHYKAAIDKKRLKALAALTKHAQDLDMGY
jgi:excisionase family DNA binding protein